MLFSKIFHKHNMPHLPHIFNKDQFKPIRKKLIHSGSEGTVSKVICQLPLKGIIIVHPVSCSILVSKEYFIAQTNERTILECLNRDSECPYIIRLYGYTPNDKLLLMEACDTDLFDWNQKNYKRIDSNLFWTITEQLLEAIQYCHKHNIIHTDIKLENIGVIEHKDGKIELKLLDFGRAIQAEQYTEINTDNLHGSLPYTAPEVIKTKLLQPEDAYAIDYWELGVVLYSLLECEFPFAISNNTETAICESEPVWNRRVDEHCKKCVCALLQKDPTNRPEKLINVQKWLSQFKEIPSDTEELKI
jgi:serine/threonine protein kinase